MEPLDLANQYMEIFFESDSIDSLADILSKNCTFKGPFYQFDSAKAYIDSLKSDPPESVSYRIIESYQNEHSACLVYKFSKPGVSTVMSQVFEVSGVKISGIHLIFDTGAIK